MISSAPTVFVTGFPGFLGTELLPRLLQRAPDHQAICLVQERFADLAKRRMNSLVAESPHLDGRIRLVVGDITEPDLGLGSQLETIAKVTTAFYHLAAVYDLSVSRQAGMRVNVDGTRNVCDFASNSLPTSDSHIATEATSCSLS